MASCRLLIAWLACQELPQYLYRPKPTDLECCSELEAKTALAQISGQSEPEQHATTGSASGCGVAQEGYARLAINNDDVASSAQARQHKVTIQDLPFASTVSSDHCRTSKNTSRPDKYHEYHARSKQSLQSLSETGAEFRSMAGKDRQRPAFHDDMLTTA